MYSPLFMFERVQVESLILTLKTLVKLRTASFLLLIFSQIVNVLMPARFKQLYERTEKSNSSIVRSKCDHQVVSTSFITSVAIAISVKFVNRFGCSVKNRQTNLRGIFWNGVPLPKFRVSLSKPSLLPTRAGSTW